MAFLLLLVVAVFSGIVGALVGLGGGIILVPAVLFLGNTLGLIQNITPQTVVGLSVIMMIFIGISSTLAYMKSKTVHFKTGLIFFIGSVPGTIFGAWINKGLDVPSFNLYFGILLIIIAIILIFRDKLKPVKWFVEHGTQFEYIDAQGKKYIYGYPVWFAISLTFLVGCMSGLFGIGGGSILVPAMLILFLFPPHVAVATSMFLVFLTALVNSASHITLGHVPWLYTLPVIVGGYFGAKIGAKINQSLNSEKIVLALRIVLLLLGIYSVLNALL